MAMIARDRRDMKECLELLRIAMGVQLEVDVYHNGKSLGITAPNDSTFSSQAARVGVDFMTAYAGILLCHFRQDTRRLGGYRQK